MNPSLASHILAPTKDSGVKNNARNPELLSGTGTTEDYNDTAFPIGRMAVIKVGATPIRIAFRGSKNVAGTVDTTDIYLAAGEMFPWVVDKYTLHVYCEAADGSSAYEAWVWQASP